MCCYLSPSSSGRSPASASVTRWLHPRAKGMWMGGPVPLGYRLDNRKLLIDDSEAKTVRLVFRRYLELGSVGALADELAQAGIRTKVRSFGNGRSVGGVFFTRGSL